MFAGTICHAAPMTKDGRRLGEAVLARRKALGYSQEDVRDRGGPSTTTLTKIEAGHGEGIRGRTISDLEDVLQWGRGSVDRVLAGGEPSELERAAAPGPRPSAIDMSPAWGEFAYATSDAAHRTVLALQEGRLDGALASAKETYIRTTLLMSSGMGMLPASGDLEQTARQVLAGVKRLTSIFHGEGWLAGSGSSAAGWA